MQVLVTGGYGLIGAAVVARLRARGDAVVATGRDVSQAARKRPDVRWVSTSFAGMKAPADWRPHLAGMDAVVNCVGMLQSNATDKLDAVHVRAALALFTACEQAGIRRVIQFSAIGVDRAQPSPFSATKLEADEAVQKLDLDWVILRPSVVLGRSAYGASALLRGVAALPAFLPVMPDTERLQVVALDDVVDTVEFFLSPAAPARRAVELAGPERLTFTEVALAYRRWLGFPEPRLWHVPRPLAALAYAAGDAIALLGWRPPLATTAAREMRRGAVGDATEWKRLTRIEPKSLAAALAAEPASVQEAWFARLYLLKPLVFAILSLFWITTGILALGPGYGYGEALMNEGGVGPVLGMLTIVGGGLLDLAIGVGIAIRRTTRAALIVSIAVSVLYAIVGTILVPRLWADPLGPMVKIWPIIVLTFVALALRTDR
jgi:uncharacterized protein YbjT (DUF2867 family)